MMPYAIHHTGLSIWGRVVWCVIVDRMYGGDTCSIGTRRLAEILNFDKKTILNAIKEIEGRELLLVKRGVSGQRHHYKLPKKSGGRDGPLATETTEKAVGETDRLVVRGTDRGGGRDGPLAVGRSDQVQTIPSTDKQTGAATAAAAVDTPEKKKQNSQVRKALVKVGIGEPNRTRLASHPDLTPDIVHEASQHSGGPGLTVVRVEEALANAKDDAEERRGRREYEKQEHARRQQQEQKMQQDAYAAKVRQALLQSLIDDGLESEWQRFQAEGNVHRVKRAIKLATEGANRRELRSFASFVFKRHFGDKQCVPTSGTEMPANTKAVEYPPDAQGHEHSVHPTTEARENLEKKEKVNA